MQHTPFKIQSKHPDSPNVRFFQQMYISFYYHLLGAFMF